MKISTRLALLAGAIVIAYPASSWMLGRQIATEVAAFQSRLQTGGLVKVVERRREQGVFRTTETLTLEVSGGVLPENGETPPSFRMALRSEFRHGPFVDGLSLGAAVSRTELVLDEDTRARFSELVGQLPAFVVRTHHRFDGGGTSTLAVPPFSLAFPVASGASTGTLSLDEINLVMDFQPDLASYTYQGRAPRIEVEDGEGGQLSMNGLSWNGAMRRVFADDNLLYSGAEQLTIGEVNVRAGEEAGNTLRLGKLVLDSEIPVRGEFVDYIGRLGAEVVQLDAKDYGPAHYDFSLRHLHARTVAGLYRAMLDAYGDQERMRLAAANPAQLFEPLAHAGQALLKHQPEFHIERIGFNSPHGEARLSGSARLGSVNDEALDNPLMLMKGLKADADIVIPEALLKAIAAGDDDGGAGGDSALDERSGMVDQQLAAWAAQGYITRDQGVIQSKLAFSDGVLTVNGKPVGPMIGSDPAPVSAISPEERVHRD